MHAFLAVPVDSGIAVSGKMLMRVHMDEAFLLDVMFQLSLHKQGPSKFLFGCPEEPCYSLLVLFSDSHQSPLMRNPGERSATFVLGDVLS